MSESSVRVVRVGRLEKHPNADRLSITMVDGGYPVIVRNGEFEEGDLAVYVPVDSLVPIEKPQWAFLEGHARIRAKKLRGVFSMGLLAKAWLGMPETIGTDVAELMGITKYEPRPDNEGKGAEDKVEWGNNPIRWCKILWYRWLYGGKGQPKMPFTFPEYTDIESLRKHGNVLKEGEEVVISEKIHGSNGRFAFYKGKLWVGSHHTFRLRPSKLATRKNNFWQAAFDCDLEKKLKKFPGIAFYGEVYGNVQKGFGYDRPAGINVRFFDCMDIKTLKYLDYDDFKAKCDAAGLERVPELYRGPWSESLRSLADGKTTLGNGAHVREGFVVRPVRERFEKMGRVCLKFVSEAYLLSKDS